MKQYLVAVGSSVFFAYVAHVGGEGGVWSRICAARAKLESAELDPINMYLHWLHRLITTTHMFYDDFILSKSLIYQTDT